MKIKFFNLTFLVWALFFTQTLCKLNNSSSSCEYCSDAISNCLSCTGENNCKKCIKSISPKCNQCTKDIFSESDFEINGEKFSSCDQSVFNHENICKIKCRGNLFQFGECVSIQEFFVCQCFNDTSTTTIQTTLTTTNRPYVQSNKIIYFLVNFL